VRVDCLCALVCITLVTTMQPPDPLGGRSKADDGDAHASPRTLRLQARAADTTDVLSAHPGLSANETMVSDNTHSQVLTDREAPSTCSVPARDTTLVADGFSSAGANAALATSESSGKPISGNSLIGMTRNNNDIGPVELDNLDAASGTCLLSGDLTSPPSDPNAPFPFRTPWPFR